MTQAPLPFTLRVAYLKAIYEVDFATGRRKFRHGAVGPAYPPFAVITAWDPGMQRRPPAENEAANQRLASCLESRRLDYVDARNFAPGGAHEEPGFAVFGLARDEALALASQFGQAAIFWWDGREGRVVFVRA